MSTTTDRNHSILGGGNTVKEIAHQPRLWKEAYQYFHTHREKIQQYLEKIYTAHARVRVIFTGAGTSAFVGDTLLPHVLKVIEPKDKVTVESIATTNLVSNPLEYFFEDIPTVLISFGRSGNSPESVATIDLASQLVKDIYHIIITCNPEGKLAKIDGERNLVLNMPEGSNDKGFAMTSSFTTMMLTAFLLFDKEIDKQEERIEALVQAGEEVERKLTNHVQQIAQNSYNRLVYLGSGVFQGLAREAALKSLELAAGKVATFFDTSLGYRHGPKSIMNEETLTVVLLSSNPHTRKYDISILEELYHETNRGKIIAVSHREDEEAAQYSDHLVNLNYDAPNDVYLAFPMVMVAQKLALEKSLLLGIAPDNPSPSGQVNRVVKGVTIYPIENRLTSERGSN
ncbi:tagatose-6-phosphate ketose/aldose isomerase [Neobacillus niacini]|uniref:SIS domain-containing protein n=1 Tax=Neobacillus niacini TaxID=86668 RepID=UPI0028562FB1|nr:SIS domain-containing protein [Neobacillus niacini]MDR7079479.1 tagatose-6-phosphate ketose/aldose isomerase [Neobacillus niacini]